MVDEDEIPKKYKDSQQYISIPNKTIYFDNFVVLATLDPIIEAHEIKQGFVSLNEVLDLIENNPKRKEEWGVTYDSEDIFICQGSWWSLDSSDRSLSIDRVLPCL